MINWQHSLVLIKSRGERKDIGTGFVIYRDKLASYVVTCAHVVKAVGGKDSVKVNGKDATVIAYGWELWEDSLDLAVIRVEGLDLVPLNLGSNAKEQDNFSTRGFFYFDSGTSIKIREVNGTLKKEDSLPIREGQDYIKGWDIEITSENPLREGYSGSPILNQQQQVIGVVTHLLEHGQKGAAISIDALPKFWLKIPSELLVNIKYPGLLNLLAFHENQISVPIKKAYKACSPDAWSNPLPDSLSKILADLEEMPQGSSQYTKIERFIARILADIEISSLTEWANQYIRDFSILLNQERQNLDSISQSKDLYLLVVLERSNQKSVSQDSDSYFIKSWIISDSQSYNYKICSACERLELEGWESKSEQETFTLDEVQQVLKFLVDKVQDQYSGNLAIELFIPLNILDHAVDSWIINEEFGFRTPIGKVYKLVIRSSERLTSPTYKPNGWRRKKWEEKWTALLKLTQTSLCSAFVLGDYDNVDDVFSKLYSPQVIGLKLAKPPAKVGEGSIFAAILATAIPVALWIRQNLPDLDCQSEIDRILDCCIYDLPESVKKERSDAPLGLNNHIGHHLSLLWENPARVPPYMNYSM